MKKELISIIIPAYNEENNIGKVLSKLLKLKHKYHFEIIVVDDGSSDNTAKVSKENGAVKVVRYKKNRGKGGAFIEGIKHAHGKYIIQIDADDQFQVADIPKFIDKLRNGYDVVCGTRFNKGKVEKGSVSSLNLFGNWLMSKTTIFFSDIPITDIMAGFKGFTKEALKKLDLSTNHFGYEAEVVVKAGKLNLRVTEVPIIYKKRMHGASSVHALKDGFRVITTIAKMYFSFPGQTLGQGVVGRKLVRFLNFLVIFIILPFFVLINTSWVEEFLVWYIASFTIYVSASFYTRSRIAAYVASSFFALHLVPQNQTLFVGGLLLPQHLINQTNVSLSTTLLFVGIASLIYLLHRKDEPAVSFMLLMALFLALGNLLTGNVIFAILSVSLGLGGITSNILLQITSFKNNKAPLFSFQRLMPFLALCTVVAFLYLIKFL